GDARSAAIEVRDFESASYALFIITIDLDRPPVHAEVEDARVRIPELGVNEDLRIADDKTLGTHGLSIVVDADRKPGEMAFPVRSAARRHVVSSLAGSAALPACSAETFVDRLTGDREVPRAHAVEDDCESVGSLVAGLGTNRVLRDLELEGVLVEDEARRERRLPLQTKLEAIGWRIHAKEAEEALDGSFLRSVPKEIEPHHFAWTRIRRRLSEAQNAQRLHNSDCREHRTTARPEHKRRRHARAEERP